MPKSKTKADLEADVARLEAENAGLAAEVDALNAGLAEALAPSDKSWLFQGQRLVETAPGRLTVVAPRGE